ncbi:c-type cytochrome [Psychrobacter sp. APC 3279]|uniref:c-type cytochrome n=1 Tax=unclassified Psychrobacter TaxID=196806 RepID=UPI00191ACEAB|nr:MULTISPECIES: c-type cytochrome [unclassified Psychrobacter]MDN3440208.1 c-type cytochrome [Psychrobacter sp. APC 3279]
MFSISKLLSTSYRAITASSAALLLIGIMFSSASAADIATTYNNSCAACHDSGALNAIKKGDSAKWQQLIKQKSMPTLIKSVKGGMPQMPAGGLCDKCSDDDYRKLIEYMSK